MSALFRQVRKFAEGTGDPNEVATAYYPIAVASALYYLDAHLLSRDLDDIVQESIMGLMIALGGSNHIDFRMSPDDCVTTPRLHHAWFPDNVVCEPDVLRVHPQTVEVLRSWGYDISPQGTLQGDAHSIWLDKDTREMVAVADHRKSGAASGY